MFTEQNCYIKDIDYRGGKQRKVWEMILLAANENGAEKFPL